MIPVLQVKDLTVILKTKKTERVIVDRVSFSVEPGKCLGVLGESGSGKSMTVKAILGLLDDRFVITGSAIYHGKELLGRSKEELRRLRGQEITMVLQNPMTCFDPLCRIGDQLAETYAAHSGISSAAIRERSIEMLRSMRIHDPEEVLEKYPHQLSGGMLQRIMIGLAMSVRPSLLIADEPTTAIDAITQFSIMQEFKAIKDKHGTAMVFVSHDLGAVSCVADSVLVMNHGKTADSGSFKDILDHAQDPYTQLLIEKRRAIMTRYRAALQSGVKGA